MVAIYLTLDDIAPSQPPAVYETVRVLDVQRLRRTLRRRPALAKILGDLLDAEPAPHIVAIDWPESDGPRLEYAIFDETVLVSSHLSLSWDETRLAGAAINAIARALLQQAQVARATFREIGDL